MSVCSTVLPAPNGPGIQAVPPRATGKNVSIMRVVVMSGSDGYCPFDQLVPQQIGRQRNADWPLLSHREWAVSVGVADAGDGVIDGEVAALNPRQLDGPFDIERNHDAVLDTAFLNGSENVAGFQAIAGAALRHERPFVFGVECVHVIAPTKEEAVARGECFQRILQAVVDCSEQTWSE